MSSLVRRYPVTCVVAALVVLACSGDQTRPGGGSDPTAPTVTALQPETFAATNLPQPVTIHGSGFDAPTVVLTSPAGDNTQLAGAQLASVSATSISAQMTVGVAGGWRVLVRNGDGKASPSFSFTVGPAAAPAVQSISPTRIGLSFGVPLPVTIRGTGFQRGCSVVLTRGEITAVSIAPDSVSATSVSFGVAVNVRNEFDLFVVNPDGQISGSAVHLSTGPSVTDPTVTSVAPSTIGAAAVKQVISFTGVGFEPGMTVNLVDPNGSGSFFHDSDVQTPAAGTVRLFTPLNVMGTWKYELDNPDGGFASGTFSVGPPLPNQTQPPVINGVSPTALTLADGEQLLTVQGSGFQAGLVAQFVVSNGGRTDSGRVVSVTPNAVQVGENVTHSGTWLVTVMNPDGTSSNGFHFTVAPQPGPPPTPTITSVPSNVHTSLAVQSVALTGSGFPENLFGQISPPTTDLNPGPPNVIAVYASPSKALLTGVFDRPGVWHLNFVAAGSAPSNSVDLVVSNPTGTPPQITGIDPAQLVMTGAPQVARLNGSNFQPGLRVIYVGDDSTREVTPVNITVDSVTSASATVRGLLATPGRFQVQNADGLLSNIFRFAENPFPLTCSAFGPFYVSKTAQPVGASCLAVKPGVTATLFDPAGMMRPISNTSLTLGSRVLFTATLDTGGFWKEVIANVDGQQSRDSFYVFTLPAPTVAGIASSPQASHVPQTITVQGTGLQNGLSARIALTNLTPIVFDPSQVSNVTTTSFQISPTLFIKGTATITVVNPDGQSALNTFTIVGQAPPPAVAAVSPSTLTAGTGRLIAVTGQGFEDQLDVIVTSPSGKATTYSRAPIVNRTVAQFQLYIGFDEQGAWQLAVRNADGQLSNAVSFTVH